jgi:hypothetical protein
MNKNELFALHAHFTQLKNDIEEHADINDVENHVDTSFGDELAEVMERRQESTKKDVSPPFDKSDVRGEKYENIGIKPTDFHKSKPQHRATVLALSRIMGECVENEQISKKLDPHIEEMVSQTVDKNRMFTDYS